MSAFWILALVGHLLAVQASSTGARTHHPCATSSDCAADECCVSINQPRGKRDADYGRRPALRMTMPGTCQRLGTTGSRCISHGNIHPPTTGLYYRCPCRRDHTCNGTGMMEVPQGEIGVCEPRVTISPVRPTLGHPCSSGGECVLNECCVNNIRPIGRRKRRAPKRSSFGRCRAMGTSGSGCFVRQTSGKPNHATFQCPCSTGLVCHGSGMYDIPLGETGRCQ